MPVRLATWMNGARLVDEGVYLSPPPHEHFELCPGRPGVFAGRVDHLSAVGAHTISARLSWVYLSRVM